jgi:ADP-ribosyl-[dinitrogen reductase] hydrolase
MITRFERYIGVLTGVLAGDALGAPYETWSSERVLADFAVRGGLVPFDYDDPWGKDGRFPAGRPTDDSELTAVLGQSLCETNGDEPDLYRRMRQCVIEKKSVLCGLPAYGFGGTTRKALAAVTYGESGLFALTHVPIPSNGSLMRASPVALRYHGDFEKVRGAAYRAGVLTHTHPLAIECTLVYTTILDEILKGAAFVRERNEFEQIVRRARQSFEGALTERALIDYLDNHCFEKPAEPTRDRRGGALITLQVALWATRQSTSFRDGITRAVGFGGDTDTYAAVAGGLLGALYGYTLIPTEWVEVLSGQGFEVMWDIARRLYTIRKIEQEQ